MTIAQRAELDSSAALLASAKKLRAAVGARILGQERVLDEILMAILAGGHALAIRTPRDAIEAGIGMVTQHFSLVRPMTVAENLALGRSSFRYDDAAARARAAEVSAHYGITVDPTARVADLSIGEQ